MNSLSGLWRDKTVEITKLFLDDSTEFDSI